MADVTPQLIEGRATIVSYGGGGFRLSSGGDAGEGERVDGPLLLSADGPIDWPTGGPAPTLDADGLARLRARVADLALEVLLIGCGARGQFIPPSERQRFRDLGIVVDAMDTGAACRTFNVLMTEDRRVAAALLPVD